MPLTIYAKPATIRQLKCALIKHISITQQLIKRENVYDCSFLNIHLRPAYTCQIQYAAFHIEHAADIANLMQQRQMSDLRAMTL